MVNRERTDDAILLEAARKRLTASGAVLSYQEALTHNCHGFNRSRKRAHTQMGNTKGLQSAPRTVKSSQSQLITSHIQLVTE